MSQSEMFPAIPPSVRNALTDLEDALKALYRTKADGGQTFSADIDVQGRMDDLNKAIQRTAYKL